MQSTCSDRSSGWWILRGFFGLVDDWSSMKDLGCTYAAALDNAGEFPGPKWPYETCVTQGAQTPPGLTRYPP